MHGIAKMFNLSQGEIDTVKEKQKRFNEKWKHISDETRQMLRIAHPIALIVRLVKYYREKITEKLKEDGIDVDDKFVSFLIDKIAFAIVSNPELISEPVLKEVLRDVLRW